MAGALIVRKSSSVLIAFLLATAISPASAGDELVYRRYYEQLVGALETGGRAESGKSAAVTERLMTVDWPDAMTAEVFSKIREISAAHENQTSAPALATYAANRHLLPGFFVDGVARELRDSDGTEKFHLVQALCYAKRVPAGLTTVLERIAVDDDLVLATVASVCLLHASPNDAKYQKRVLRLLNNPNPDIASRTADALSRLPPEEVSPFTGELSELLHSHDPKVRVTSANALLAFDITNNQALAVAASCLKDSGSSICIGYLTPSNMGTPLRDYAAAVFFDRAEKHLTKN